MNSKITRIYRYRIRWIANGKQHEVRLCERSIMLALLKASIQNAPAGASRPMIVREG